MANPQDGVIQAYHDATYSTSSSKVCANCHERLGTVAWVGEGSALDYVHGMYAMWCDLCVARYSLEYARKQAARIPELEADVARLARHASEMT